ncbi:N-acetylmuramidase family protein [Bacteroides oleiciplenus]|uniref:N-acetylmuramidase family protein n=1 Tax=Bacteroides oleiciplenus TaxID=626931 RepID=UPI00216AEBD7|nr:N-acetylmuramidase family protein [Bacteroides oleiciplenus]
MKTIKLGYEGKEVTLLQQALKSSGYSMSEGRVFTPETADAVVKFQQSHSLDADGIVSYRTWEALLLAGYKFVERLADGDFELVARLLDCELDVLKAVRQVETGGRGVFFASGKPAIFFEGHIFGSQLKKRGLNPAEYVAGNENILYPKWEKGHYKGGMGSMTVWNRHARFTLRRQTLPLCMRANSSN